MILKAEDVADRLEIGLNPNEKDPLVISPHSDIKTIRKSGSASIDLRLGTWFVNLKKAKIEKIEIGQSEHEAQIEKIKIGQSEHEAQLAETHYVPFGNEYLLHPRSFVLGTTLEWLRLPKDLSAYVIGKSSWGRRGLIIATATGVHPGFPGCLTLELTNVGEIPIEIQPGIKICQIFFHKVCKPVSKHIDQSQFIGSRKPKLGKIKRDIIADKLAKAQLDENSLL